jgi:hypothetical protein
MAAEWEELGRRCEKGCHRGGRMPHQGGGERLVELGIPVGKDAAREGEDAMVERGRRETPIWGEDVVPSATVCCLA